VSADVPGVTEASGGEATGGQPDPPAATAERSRQRPCFRVDCAVCGWLFSTDPTGLFTRSGAHRRAGRHEGERSAAHDCSVAAVEGGERA